MREREGRLAAAVALDRAHELAVPVEGSWRGAARGDLRQQSVGLAYRPVGDRTDAERGHDLGA